MNKDKAIDYLVQKGIIKDVSEPKEVKDVDNDKNYTEKEKAEIKKVMKSGKIFGDPCVEINKW